MFIEPLRLDLSKYRAGPELVNISLSFTVTEYPTPQWLNIIEAWFSLKLYVHFRTAKSKLKTG